MKFWEVVKEVSAQPVRREADRVFTLSLAGQPDAVDEARALALGPGLTPEEAAAADPFLFAISPPYSDADERRLRYSDLLVSLPGGPGITEFRPADTVQLDDPKDLHRVVLARRPELLVPLGRRLPGFRTAAAEQIIRDVSRINAEFATISGVGQAIPIIAPIFPVVAGADVFVLTKNQVLMVFRLAAIYGEALDLKSRAREVAPVIGSAFGWRTIARQLFGALPGALGLPVRAGIAYSATYATGRAAQMVFDKGRRPTRREMLRIYEEGSRLAKDSVARLTRRTSRSDNGHPMLAAPPDQSGEEPDAEVISAAEDEGSGVRG